MRTAMGKLTDYAIVADTDRKFTWHRADCPEVRLMAKQSLPVMTMMGCERTPPAEARKHSCLTEETKP